MTVMPVSLYIHFPFCVRKCLYCDFASVADSPLTPSEYAAAVVAEMELRARLLAGPVSAPTLYLGGGTPSLMAPADVAALIEAATRLYGLSPDAEVTIEANPGTVTLESLAGYRAAGVNRLSLGVQSLHDPLLARLGRVHTAAEAVAAFGAARAAGFANIGIDLIHSLPGEDLSLWQHDLERAVALSPDHVSAYPLAVEEGTPFARMEERGELPLPDEEEAAAMFELTSSFLGAQGYGQYELANFARPGHRSRHNQVYWRRGNYLGFGAAAHSFLRTPGFGRRWHNSAAPGDYLARVRHGTLPEEGLTLLSRPEAMGEFLFLGLRLLDGVDAALFRREFGVTIEAAFPAEVAELTAAGLLERSGEGFRLARRVLPLANQVFMRFV
ncbi:MAG TPA: radical SAM family heme chaperone HemW [Geobacteraceae bacterium]